MSKVQTFCVSVQREIIQVYIILVFVN